MPRRSRSSATPKQSLQRLEDDGLFTPSVGAWGEQKYRLVATYAAMFASSMKGKWGSRVYVDLFAGSGRGRIDGSSHIVPGSPTIALELAVPFDHHVFCEQDPNCLAALKARVARSSRSDSTTIVDGNCNERIHDVLSAIPMHRPGFGVLTFCFVDPFNLANLRFSTIRQLSVRYIDFLVLLPTYMDGNRNAAHYLAPQNTTMDDFLGTTSWREKWQAMQGKLPFGAFIAGAFDEQMKAIGYEYGGVTEMVQIRNKDNNSPLYHLAFFSRNE